MTQLAFDGSNPLDDIRLAYSSIPNWYALRIFYNRIEPLRQTLDVAAIRYFYPHHLVEKCSDGGLDYVQEPIIKSLIFIRSTCESLDMIRLKHVGSVSPYFDHRTRKRENVKVLRNENGKMLTYEVNLCSAADLIASPAYYIRQNDVIYVDPNDVRARQSTVNGNNVRSTSFWISLTSLAASITNTIVIIATRSGSGK